MKTGTLIYGEQKKDYAVLESTSLAKKIVIHVYPNGCIEVEAPKNSSQSEIEQAVSKRARWIMRQLKVSSDAKKHVLPREYVSGETHFYLGRRYQLKVNCSTSEPSSVKMRAGRIIITLRHPDSAAVRRRLHSWYKERAFDYFSRRLIAVSEEIIWLENKPEFKLVRMQKQWGSCSPTGAINLNPDLIKAPRDCIDYVIAHEICHIREHNHSKQYYSLLEHCCPNWKHTKAKLDAMAELILSF
jgi:predicted metal-dependent hydrolase